MRTTREFPLPLIILIPLGIGLALSLAPRPVVLQEDLSVARQVTGGATGNGQASRLQDVLAWEPWRTTLWETIGEKYLESGNLAPAIKAFQTAEDLGMLSSQGWKAMGDAELALGDWQAAVSDWREVLDSSQGASDGLFSQVLSQQWDHRAFPDALKTALDWSEKRPQTSQAWFKAGLLECVENPTDAPQYLAKAAGLDTSLKPQSDALSQAIQTAYQQDHEGYRRVVVGRALANLGYWDLAQKSFEIATVSSPDYAEGWAFLSEALQQTNQDGSAALKKAQALDPNSIVVKGFTALWERSNNQVDAAFDELKQIAQLQPDQAVWQIELGNTVVMQGDLTVALQYYQHATELEPSNPQTWMALANFSAVNLTQLQEVGLPAARTALTLTSNSAEALDLMGRVMLGLEDTASAERFLQQAIDKDASYAAAYLHLGQLYLDEKQPDKAYPLIKKASDLAGSDAETGMFAKRLLDRYFGGQ